MRGWVLVSVVWVLQVLGCHALGGYPGTFYQIMLRLNKERKYARTAPSPSRLWAILDPAASLGSLSHEPLNSNRIIRSADYLSRMWEPRQVREEEAAALETNEASTENPVTEAHKEDAGTEVLTQEAQTEAPTEAGVDIASPTGGPATQPPPVAEECGGNITMTEIPSTVTVQEGAKYEEVLVTPGWEAGQYPESTECVWNLHVGLECQAGLLLYKVLDGEVRETQNCIEDYLEVIQPNGYTTKYCGPLTMNGNHVSGTDTWNSAQLRTTTLRFRSEVRSGDRSSAGNPKGLKLQVTYYCWLYNKDLLSTTTTKAPEEVVPQGGTATSGETPIATSNNSATTGGDASVTDVDTSSTGGDADTTGGETDTTGGETDTTGGDADTTGGDAGPTGGETDTTGEGGVSGGEADATGEVAGTAGGETDTTSGATETTGGDSVSGGDGDTPGSDSDITGGDTNTAGGDAGTTDEDASTTGGDAVMTRGGASTTGGDTGITGGDNGTTGGDNGTTGGDDGTTGGDTGTTGGDPDMTHGDTSTTDGDTGMTDGDVGTTGGDTGMTGGESDTTGGDAGMTGDVGTTDGDAGMTVGDAGTTDGDTDMTIGDADTIVGDSGTTGGDAGATIED
ncbi:uncharacterized protein [Panulirus ornatus]|uniref:uncharacterized protein n=1 Tax=Panulirus ornatus TaxID=150431 RepID=UPI003A848A61